jgi:hypothetical protein
VDESFKIGEKIKRTKSRRTDNGTFDKVQTDMLWQFTRNNSNHNNISKKAHPFGRNIRTYSSISVIKQNKQLNGK